VINFFGRAHYNYAKFHYNRISQWFERIEDKQTHFFIYIEEEEEEEEEEEGEEEAR
jgi:hypothetical protein